MRKRTNVEFLPIEGELHFGPKKGVAQSVVNRVLDLIRTGMLRAGDRLPSERNLIEILDISRPSLREALRALSILGVVRHAPRRGRVCDQPRGTHTLGTARFLSGLVGSELD